MFAKFIHLFPWIPAYSEMSLQYLNAEICDFCFCSMTTTMAGVDEADTAEDILSGKY